LASSLNGLGQSATPTNEVNDLDENQSVHHDSGWTVANKPNPLNLNGVSGWTDETPLNGEREGNGDAVEAQGLAAQGLEAAKRGHDWLRAFWAELTPDEREAVGGQDALARCKIIAARRRPTPPGSRSLRKESI
jgi:hypothetical protein